MEKLIKKVEEWFVDRQIIENSTALKQALKTSEEVLELQNAIIDNDLEEIKDAIGNIQVTLIGVCLHYGINFHYIIDEIKQNKIEVKTDGFKESIYAERMCNILKDGIKNGLKNTDEISGYIIYICYDLKDTAYNYNITLEECLQSVYNVISKRKGKMINGQFVKNEGVISKFKKYKRAQIAELRPITDEEIELGRLLPFSTNCRRGISVSETDLKNGSPKIGDMIARNPKNHKDQWLVAKQYFNDNFEEI